MSGTEQAHTQKARCPPGGMSVVAQLQEAQLLAQAVCTDAYREVRAHEVCDVDGICPAGRRHLGARVVRARRVRFAGDAGLPVHDERVAVTCRLHPAVDEEEKIACAYWFHTASIGRLAVSTSSLCRVKRWNLTSWKLQVQKIS